jgi:hypothetical protein
MKAVCAAVLLGLFSSQQALAWGQEGHSIIAEVAQREVNPSTRDAIDKLLNHGTLAAVSSWADDVKFTTRPETYPWHFVDIPLAQATYATADCNDRTHPQFPNTCLVTALNMLKNALACASDDNTKRDNLKLIVHLIGDATQPLHTVDDLVGGNGLVVTLSFCGLKDNQCQHAPSVKFHVLWDSTLITETFYDWGAYVDRLYDPSSGWLNSAEAHQPDPAGDDPTAWVNDTHAASQKIWTQMLQNNTIDQAYYTGVLPILDRQLGIAGLRLARYLDAAFAPNACAAR